MREILLSTLAVLLTFAGVTGCHAQVPVTAHSVTLNWQAPTTGVPCTATNPCSYVASRIAATGTTCPAVNLTTQNYAPVNSASPVKALTFVDTGALGQTVCYIVQAEQGGGASLSVGPPSNTAGPFVVPDNPGAPTLGGAVSEIQQPALPAPAAPGGAAVVAKLEGRVN